MRHPIPPPRAINAAWSTISLPHTTAPTSLSYDSAMPKVTAGVRPNVRATSSPIIIKSPFDNTEMGALSLSLTRLLERGNKSPPFSKKPTNSGVGGVTSDTPHSRRGLFAESTVRTRSEVGE
ncbi:hypothetical protein BHM03_00025448 [Ensete ventricosum]|nr:hypothetical protein BHM03_00025448 [Ensete ventricosum]